MVWAKGQSGNISGRQIKADDDWLPGETQAERAKRRNRERAAKWRAENPERLVELQRASLLRRKERWDTFLAYERQRYEKQKETILSRQSCWRDANRELQRERNRASYRKAPHKARAHWSLRRARLLKATPPWANLKAMEAFYEEARRKTLETGEQWEVDHIHPLRNKMLCGLHVPCNLQIITRTKNRVKLNKIWHD